MTKKEGRGWKGKGEEREERRGEREKRGEERGRKEWRGTRNDDKRADRIAGCPV